MFWRVASGSVTSSVNAILDKADFTLEDLLAENDLLQDLHSPNQRLLDFLSDREQLLELVRIALGPVPPADPDLDAYKLPYAACEALCCESDRILDGLVSEEGVLERLFAYPEAEGPLDAVTSTFFARIVTHITRTRASSVLAWLQEHRAVLSSLTARLGDPGLAEVTVVLIGADDQLAASASRQDFAWLSETSLLSDLVDRSEWAQDNILLTARLESGAAHDSSTECAAEILAAIARAKHSPLTGQLGGAGTLQRLLARTVHATTTEAIIQPLNICIALVERCRLWHVAHQSGLATPPLDADMGLEARAVEVLSPHIAPLLDHLTELQKDKRQETPYGLLRSPLGSARLTVIALLSVLLRTGLHAAEQAVTEAGLLKRCFALFVDYPFNSILHHQVSTIIGTVLECGTEDLLQHLFDDCSLLSWLISVPGTTTVTRRDAEGESSDVELQAGYTGHITQIGHRLLAAAAERAPVEQYLEAHDGWQDFVQGRLTEAMKREDYSAWECGRPDQRRVVGGSDSEDGGGEPPGGFRTLSSFQATLDDSDSDSDEEGYTDADRMFADAPDQPREDFQDLASAPALRDLVSELSSLGPVSDSPRDSAQLFNRRTRVFGAPKPSVDGVDELEEPETDAMPQSRGQPAAPASWEELDQEVHIDGNTVRRLPSLEDTVAGLASARDGSILSNGFHPGPEAVPSRGSGPLHDAVQASILPEKARLSPAGGVRSPGGNAPATDLAELRQPGSPDWADSDKRGVVAPRATRQGSSDLEDHPYSAQSSLDAEDLRAETAAIDPKELAELDQLDFEESEPTRDSRRSRTIVASGKDSEVHTPLGNFTKLTVRGPD